MCAIILSEIALNRAQIIIKHVASTEQRADILTKAMTVAKFERMRELLGVVDLHNV